MTDESEETTAADESSGTESSDDKRTQWLEIAAAIMLSFAVVGAAWAGYESARWGGEQATATAAGNGVRLESSRAQTRGGQLVQVDIALFFQAVNALATGDDATASFYADRFRDEFTPIFDEWIALDPINTPDAPLTPFALESYQVSELELAEELGAEADLLTETSAKARSNAQNYTIALVLFAIAIFFASIAMRFTAFRSRVFLLGLGIVLFVAVAGWMSSLPKSVSL